MVWRDLVLLIVILLLTAVLGVLYYFIKFNINFLKQIQSINGIHLDNLEIGQKAPFFRTYSDKGEKVIAKNLFSNRNTLMLFISTNCPTCKSLLPDLKTLSSNYNINFAIINSDELSNDAHISEKVDSSNIIYIRSNSITSLYFIQNVPFGVLIDEGGTILLSNYIKGTNVLYNMLLNENSNTRAVSI